MQNDYLWEKRKQMFTYNTSELTDSVNRAIHSYKEKGWDIIYISQIFPDIITNRWIIGFSIANTEGAKLYGGLDVVSDLCSTKISPTHLLRKSSASTLLLRAMTKWQSAVSTSADVLEQQLSELSGQD